MVTSCQDVFAKERREKWKIMGRKKEERERGRREGERGEKGADERGRREERMTE